MAKEKSFMANIKKLEQVRQGNQKAARDVFTWLITVYDRGLVGRGQRDTTIRPYIALVWYTLQKDRGTKGYKAPALKKVPAVHKDKLMHTMDGKDKVWQGAVEKAIAEGWLMHDHSYKPGEVWIRHRSRVEGASVFYPERNGDTGIFATLLVLAGGILAVEIIERMTGRRVKNGERTRNF